MDRLTQLQDAIDAVQYLHGGTHSFHGMVELNPDIPVTQPKEVPADFQSNVQELVSDLVKKAKEIDSLIEVLPGINQTEDEQLKLLQSLEEENRIANEEYEEAVKEMEEVKEQINKSLQAIAE